MTKSEGDDRGARFNLDGFAETALPPTLVELTFYCGLNVTAK
jgi:hypothetical protein